MTMDINSMLYRLCSVDGVSGDERSASEIALSMLKSYTDDCSIDDFGNVIGHIKSTGNKPKLLLDAHIDRVGLIVSFIDDNGFIKVGAVGGPDRRVLAAQSVTIHGKEKVKGVVSVLPPHVKSGDGVPKIEEIVIDTGYTKQELERIELLVPPMAVQDDFVAFAQQSDKSKFAVQSCSNLNLWSSSEILFLVRRMSNCLDSEKFVC